ncbi:unnamed protein product, partial [Porites evermanni]
QSTQCGSTQASYQRNEKQENFTSYENLLRDYLWDREFTLSWLREEGLIASSRNCTMCGSEMNWVRRGDRSHGYIWECRRQINGKRHRCERSIREGSWFENSNMTIEEQIKQQLGLGSHTAVDGDMFCREVCEVALFDGREKIGAKLPTHHRKKEHYSSYLAEFKWRYIHSGEDLWKVFLNDIKKIYKFK